MTKTYLKYRRRIGVLTTLTLLVWAGLGFRLFQIQVIMGDKFREKGIKQGLKKEIIKPLRGNIHDRNNVALSQNIIRYNIGAHPHLVTDSLEIAKTLAAGTGQPENIYLDKLSRGNRFVYLERNLRKDECSSLLENGYDGIVIEKNSRRYYPQGKILGQLIGFTNVDDAGLTGVEKRFESFLSGTSGWVVRQRNGRGISTPNNRFPYQSPVNGSSIQMTIDLGYQSILVEELERRVSETGALSGTGIIINPQTGELLAMASVPDFDPNKSNLYPTENQRIKSITDQFEPGSTFKIVAAAAALDQGLVTPNDEFYCENGSYKYKSVNISDHEEYGLLNVSQIMEFSSNVGIIKITETLNPSTFYKYSRNFGFGSLTTLNLDGETSGTLRKVDQWSELSMAEMSMGHEVGVTALQLAMSFAVIANDGYLLKPFLINQIIGSNDKVLYTEKPEVIRRVIPKKVAQSIAGMLIKAVETGTGTAAGIPGWNVAGKTGTAQKFIDGKYSQEKFISNFVGFFPAENPQLLGVFILDEPEYGYHWGGIGAAVMFSRTMSRIINLDDSIQPVPYSPPETHESPVLVKAEPVTVQSPPVLLSIQTGYEEDMSENKKFITPEVRGMSLRKAVTTFRQAGLKTRIRGSGTVQWQSPPPGTRVKPGTICEIGLQ